MATSPTTLAGPSTPVSAPEPPAAKFPVVPLLVAVLVGVAIAAIAVAGAVYYLASTGRLPRQASSAAKTQPSVSAATHMMVLEPLLVNLADAGGNAYLRVSVALRVADAADKKAAGDAAGSDPVAAVRDTALMVLGRQTSNSLLAADGKEQLKAELKAALAKHNPKLKVVDIFFTDFLVQR